MRIIEKFNLSFWILLMLWGSPWFKWVVNTALGYMTLHPEVCFKVLSIFIFINFKAAHTSQLSQPYSSKNLPIKCAYLSFIAVASGHNPILRRLLLQPRICVVTERTDRRGERIQAGFLSFLSISAVGSFRAPALPSRLLLLFCL